jgi:hypothetical protein
MKGLIFVELIRMAESVMSEEQVDDILDEANLQSDAAYSTVGKYPCSELLTLVEAFGKHLDTPVENLYVRFGHWIFSTFANSNPAFFHGRSDAFDMLEAIDCEIHVEVRKLYPDAELPRFETERSGENELIMRYRSDRPLRHFCLGMIEACVQHFGRPAEVTMSDVEGANACSADFSVRWVA